MTRMILILVMAEEKWEEADFLHKQIESRGHKAWILDMGLLGEARGRCDIKRQEVIIASGRGAADVALITDRGKRMPVMIEGGRQKVRDLYSQGQVSGIVSLGGTTGTQMGTSVMKALPFGVPKLAVSSTASLPGFAPRMVEGAAGAYRAATGEGKTARVAMTHFGPCEQCAVHVRKGLEQKGYEVIGFSAAGIGDRAMEEIIIEQQVVFSAVIDLAPGGVGEELFGFGRAAGPTRLEAAGMKGIPQIIAPCGVNFGTPLKRKYRPEYESRKKFDYDSARTFLRLSKKEMIMVADEIARKLNRARGPVKVFIPLGGWSSADRRGTEFYDQDLDRAFVNELTGKLRKEIEVKKVDADLDTPEFARAIVDAAIEIL
jgi:uncharacterized protein (UPF0261 family)